MRRSRQHARTHLHPQCGIVSFSIAVLLVACSSESPPVDSSCELSPGPDPRLGEVVIGHGQGGFEPLEPGQTVEVFRGIQGGYHIYIQARIQGLDPGSGAREETPKTKVSAFRTSGEEVDAVPCPYRIGYVEAGGGALELPSGVPLVLQSHLFPEADGEQIRVVLEILDRAGTYATDEQMVTLDLPSPADAGVDAGAQDAGTDAGT
jgi:hypothetical protein